MIDKRLASEVKHLGIGLTFEPVHSLCPWVTASGTCTTSWYTDDNSIKFQHINVLPSCHRRIIDAMVAHELGHAIAYRGPLREFVWPAIMLSSPSRARICVSLETEAWDLGEAVLRRLAIPYDRSVFWQVRELCLNSYRRDFGFPMARHVKFAKWIMAAIG